MNIDQANAWKAAMAAEEKQRAERVAAWQEEEQRQREQACKIVNHHFRHPDIAYSFRPPSYWGIPGSPLELVLRNVKGNKTPGDDPRLLRTGATRPVGAGSGS
jgi:hypothetical protein